MEEGTTVGTRAMPVGPVRRLRRRVFVRGRGSKRFFLGLSLSSSFLSLLLELAGGPPSMPGGTFPIVCVNLDDVKRRKGAEII